MTGPLANRYRVVDDYSTSYFVTFAEALDCATNAARAGRVVYLHGPGAGADLTDGLTDAERAQREAVLDECEGDDEEANAPELDPLDRMDPDYCSDEEDCP